MSPVIEQQRQHLANTLEAVQRNVYFFHASLAKLNWPLDKALLERRYKDTDLFETLAAINERFAKLQDGLASTMRQMALLMDVNSPNFLKTLAYFEKAGVLVSVEQWQECRIIRNIAAHDYDLGYQAIAEHFNTLFSHSSTLLCTAQRVLQMAEDELSVTPASARFAKEFAEIVGNPAC